MYAYIHRPLIVQNQYRFSLTNGELLIGSTGNPPVSATLTPGSGISIANNPGSITITATGTPAFMWTNVTGATQTLVSNNGYLANRSSLITFTLPATSTMGDEIIILGYGSGGWTIAQNSGQTIQVGAITSTSGAGGSVSSTGQTDCITLRCAVANDVWIAESFVGNLTIV